MIQRPIAFASTGLVVASQHRDPFEQRRFPSAVFANDDRDGAIEVECEIGLKERQAEGIGIAVANPGRIQPEAFQVRCGQTAGTLLSRHSFLQNCRPIFLTQHFG